MLMGRSPQEHVVFTQSFWGTAAVGWVPLWQWCWNHFYAASSVVWKREAEVKLQVCKWQWTLLGSPMLGQWWGNPGGPHKSGNLPNCLEFPLQTSVSGNSQTIVTNMISLPRPVQVGSRISELFYKISQKGYLSISLSKITFKQTTAEC